MPKRTDISSILAIGAGRPLPDGEGLGWGSEAARPRVCAGVDPSSPTLSRRGRGHVGLFGNVVFEPGVAVGVESELFGDSQDHTVDVLQHVVVPETDHAITVRFDQPGSLIVGGVVGVLPAVDFDGQLEAAAGEIDDEVADLILARELNAELFAAQARPQASFRVRRLAPQSLRYRRQALDRHASDSPTQPSPERGRAFEAIAA